MRHKGVVFGILIAVIAIAIPITLLVIDSLKTSTLLIFVTPLDATITINGKQYPNGNYRLFPQNGQVTATISKDGYQSKEISLSLESNKTTTLYTYLVCDNGELYCYLKDTESYNLLKYLNNSDEALTSFLKKSAIASILPISTGDLSVSLNLEKSKDQIYLDVFDLSGENKNLVYDILKQSGFDINDYYINYIYNEDTNPYLYGFGKRD